MRLLHKRLRLFWLEFRARAVCEMAGVVTGPCATVLALHYTVPRSDLLCGVIDAIFDRRAADHADGANQRPPCRPPPCLCLPLAIVQAQALGPLLGPRWTRFVLRPPRQYCLGNAAFGLARTLDGRQISSDFSRKDGRHVHGDTVRLSRLPHRGFDRDAGAKNHQPLRVHGRGAPLVAVMCPVVTAVGIVHSEMFPLLNATGPTARTLSDLVEPACRARW